MSQQVSNEQLMEVLFELKGDVGAIMAEVRGVSERLSTHVEDDKGLASDIHEMQLRQARQKGALAAITGIGSIAGAVIGYAISLWAHK